MKKLLLVLCTFSFLTSCEEAVEKIKDQVQEINESRASKVMYLDRCMNIYNGIYKGHEYTVFIWGEEKMSIEHNLDCKKCLEKFD